MLHVDARSANRGKQSARHARLKRIASEQKAGPGYFCAQVLRPAVQVEYGARARSRKEEIPGMIQLVGEISNAAPHRSH
jgi:hypothetical protein